MISKKKSNYILLPISFSIIIIAISLIPLPELPEWEFVAADKLGHLIAFLFLTFTYLWAFSKHSEWSLSTKKIQILSFFISVGIGGLIELLQHLLPINRFGDIYDFYFDIAGVLMAILIYLIMKRSNILLSLIFLIFLSTLNAQETQSAEEFQKQLNEEFSHPDESPLDSADRLHFKALDFYPIDKKFKVEATLEKQNSPNFFGMETTTERRPEYRVWAYAYFNIEDKEYKLTIYQNKKLMNTLEYGDYLFLPFTDLTNGEETYYGGRYVDLRIPDGDKIVIDFNKAYNPYCAYSKRYSCPIVPKENHLDAHIQAGVKKYH